MKKSWPSLQVKLFSCLKPMDSVENMPELHGIKLTDARRRLQTLQPRQADPAGLWSIISFQSGARSLRRSVLRHLIIRLNRALAEMLKQDPTSVYASGALRRASLSDYPVTDR